MLWIRYLGICNIVISIRSLQNHIFNYSNTVYRVPPILSDGSGMYCTPNFKFTAVTVYGTVCSPNDNPCANSSGADKKSDAIFDTFGIADSV